MVIVDECKRRSLRAGMLCTTRIVSPYQAPRAPLGDSARPDGSYPSLLARVGPIGHWSLAGLASTCVNHPHLASTFPHLATTEKTTRMRETTIPLSLCPGPAPRDLPPISAVLGTCSPAAAIYLALGFLDLSSLPPFDSVSPSHLPQSQLTTGRTARPLLPRTHNHRSATCPAIRYRCGGRTNPPETDPRPGEGGCALLSQLEARGITPLPSLERS